jgi:hypothetical protein
MHMSVERVVMIRQMPVEAEFSRYGRGDPTPSLEIDPSLRSARADTELRTALAAGDCLLQREPALHDSL